MMQLPARPHLLIIFGPTGVGKSDFAEQIAQHIPAEIINMDVGQLYTPLTIGTAKPDWQHSPIKHHLFDVKNTPDDYSVIAYRAHAQQIMQEGWRRGKLPILVGGSGFYLRSLLFPLPVPITGMDNMVEVSKDTVAQRWAELARIDPVRAASIDRHDVYRVRRALTIWHGTGVKPSTFVCAYEPPAPFTLLYITRSREQLYDRINLRVDQMMAAGWAEEVKAILGTEWESFLLRKKLIGYNELIEYFRGAHTPDDLARAVYLIKQRTRHYAKRQDTFWRMLKAALAEQGVGDVLESEQDCAYAVNLTLLNADLCIKLVLQRLEACWHKTGSDNQ